MSLGQPASTIGSTLSPYSATTAVSFPLSLSLKGDVL